MLIADKLCKSYRRNIDTVRVLHDLELVVQPGEFLSIVGASGSGKSTLLHLLGTLDAPDSGSLLFEGRRIDLLGNRERDRLRNNTFGFIFQFYHLLPELSALDNVLMPAYIAHSMWSWWRVRGQWRKRATELLERVGLGDRLHHKPRELSGGEMQRAAIARALLNHPKILLADEPTGNLDVETGLDVMRLLKDLNKKDGITIIMVTHNLELAAMTDRVLRMSHGQILPDAALTR